MGSEHYCLRWNNHQSNLLGVFSQLLHDESLVDVTLACSEGTSIRAHKVVLSACSSYFQSLFVDHPSRHPIVILKDVRFAELQTLVEFMYKGEVNVEYCQLSALLKTAESLKVKGLAEMTTVSATTQPAATGPPASSCAASSPVDDHEVAQDLAPTRSPSVSAMPPTPPIRPLSAHTRPPSASPPRASPLLNVRRTRHELPLSSCDPNPRSQPSPPSPQPTPPRFVTKDEPPDEEMRASSPEDDMSSIHSNGGHSDNMGINMSISTNMNSLAGAELRLAGLAGLPGLPGLGGRHAPLGLVPHGVHGSHGVHGVHPLLPSPRGEPIAGPSGLPPVQQVPLVVWNLFSHCASLKKEVDWDRTPDDKSGGESSSDYRMSHESETHDGGGRLRDDGDAQLYPCIYCGAAFPHQSKLTRHILSHSLETLKYREAVCGVGRVPLGPGSVLSVPPPPMSARDSPFAPLHPEDMSLDMDLGQVEPGNVVLCKFCGKSFPDVSSLIAHLPVHTGDRPFKCEFCGKAFKLRHHMKDHCRVHTGERPFRCALCGKTFSRSTILKAHEKTHYPKYVRKFLSPSPVDTEEESPHQ